MKQATGHNMLLASLGLLIPTYDVIQVNNTLVLTVQRKWLMGSKLN